MRSNNLIDNCASLYIHNKIIIKYLQMQIGKYLQWKLRSIVLAEIAVYVLNKFSNSIFLKTKPYVKKLYFIFSIQFYARNHPLVVCITISRTSCMFGTILKFRPRGNKFLTDICMFVLCWIMLGAVSHSPSTNSPFKLNQFCKQNFEMTSNLRYLADMSFLFETENYCNKYIHK